MPRKNSARRKNRTSKHESSQQPFRVGRSRTGLGLFAVAPIKKGAFIVEYWGKPMRSEEADKLYTKYLFDLGNGWTIDGADRSNVARYANHSCKPNAEARVGRRSVRIYAAKTIRPGDEITYDYGREYFEQILEPIGCKCAACAGEAGRASRRRTQRNGVSATHRT
jgi:SET domain-containing protein